LLPLNNFDYIFELSETNGNGEQDTVLLENFIIKGGESPANGGFFMLATGEGKLERLNQLIADKERQAEFDPVKGWGHEIVPPDEWTTRRRKPGTRWNFLAADGDQGLLYHWVKYEEKSVSISSGNVENWQATTDGQVELVQNVKKPFQSVNKTRPVPCFYRSCGNPPRSDFIHFVSDGKPWVKGLPTDLQPETRHKSPIHLWFAILKELNNEFDLRIDFDSIKTKFQRPNYSKPANETSYAETF